MRVINTRPLPDAEPLTRALEALGHEVIEAPLLEIVFGPDPGTLELGGVQAVLATSANGVRALARFTDNRGVLLLTVGDASARTAEELGFSHVTSATGDVNALASAVIAACDPSGGELLHVSGTRIAGDLGGALAAAGFPVRRVILYEARVVDGLPVPVASALESGAVEAAVFFSPRTARTFVRLLGDAGLAETCHMLNAYCLSPAVAEEVSEVDWRAVVTAARPDQDSLLDCLSRTALSHASSSQASRS